MATKVELVGLQNLSLPSLRLYPRQGVSGLAFTVIPCIGFESGFGPLLSS